MTSSSPDTEAVTSCARCGEETEIEPGKYSYCQDCCDLFDEVRKNGIVVRSRHGNREFRKYPYEAPPINGRDPQNQTEALAAGLKAMERLDCRGLFVYQKTGSTWLISEYLEAHPSIAEDVKSYRRKASRSSENEDILSRLLPF